MSEEAVNGNNLTGKQKLFADYYVGECSLNATRAAARAGYAGDENTKAVTGSRLLRNAKVRAYIDEQLKDLAASPSEILTILTRQAKGSLADVLDAHGDFDLDDAKKRGVDTLLKKLKVKERYDPVDKEIERTYEYELYDAQSAAVHLGKVYKLFTDRIEHGGNLGFSWSDISNAAKDAKNLTDGD
jgi:phage terminase small subunit